MIFLVWVWPLSRTWTLRVEAELASKARNTAGDHMALMRETVGRRMIQGRGAGVLE